MNNCHLVIMAKTPQLSAVKTRLEKTLGIDGAYAAHCSLVLDTLGRFADSPWRVHLWTTDHSIQVEAWSTQYGYARYEQHGADLGARMAFCLQSEFERGAHRAIVIGTDCPGIDQTYVQGAFEQLEQHDVVVGPAADGGYGMIGLKEPQPDLFSAITWGSDKVFDETLRRIETLGLSVSIAATIWDVDEPADWARFLAE